jgi:hypothetical protein
MMNRFKKYNYEIHFLAFAMMVISSIALYFTALAGTVPLVIFFIAIFALSNVLVLLVP